MTLSHSLFPAITLVFASLSGGGATQVPIFERKEVTAEISVIAFGIIEDTRCPDPAFCFRDNRLKVAAIVSYLGEEREVVLELGKPLPVGPGTLTLSAAGTPPNPNGAIRLGKYRLDLVYRPRG